jgi:predicted RNase H-like nuclease
MRIIQGVDGCKSGWVVISKDLDTGDFSWKLCRSARDFIHSGMHSQLIVIDIPIGLPDQGPRLCDIEARKLLRPGRASSVFPAPIRLVLAAKGYAEACQIRYRIEGKKMSLQSWAITPKIGQIDSLLRQKPEFQNRVREAHPEVSFYYLAGEKPLKYSKKSRNGRAERYQILETIFGQWLQTILGKRYELESAEDDVLDAFAMLWTAERIVLGKSQIIPMASEVDSYGIRMEIVA